MKHCECCKKEIIRVVASNQKYCPSCSLFIYDLRMKYTKRIAKLNKELHSLQNY